MSYLVERVSFFFFFLHPGISIQNVHQKVDGNIANDLHYIKIIQNIQDMEVWQMTRNTESSDTWNDI